jgi:hypothetical protein
VSFALRSDTVFDTFPWPQFDAGSRRRQSAQTSSGATQGNQRGLTSAATAAVEKIRAVAEASRALRREIMAANDWSRRDLYRTLEIPGANRLRAAPAALDTAVRAAYGMKPDEDILAFLLQLNLTLAEQEAKGQPITPPGLPAFVPEPASFVTADCVQCR